MVLWGEDSQLFVKNAYICVTQPSAGAEVSFLAKTMSGYETRLTNSNKLRQPTFNYELAESVCAVASLCLVFGKL